MRIAILSDIHGNLTALEAVLRDIQLAAPDLVLVGGDLAHSGASPAEVVDRIRDLRWPAILGNVDQIMADPQPLDAFAATSSAPPSLWAAIREVAAFTRDALGPGRIAWLQSLPTAWTSDTLALVHATPADLWRAPASNAPDADLEAAFAPLARPTVVYAHIHTPFVRHLPTLTIANTGSVGLPLDADPRASWLLLDNAQPTIRRVHYDRDTEYRRLITSHIPHPDWITRILQSATPQLP
jgi:predicted phosphodiesterase